MESINVFSAFDGIISEHLGVQPIEINSSRVSAQNRSRLYWTNIPDVKQPEDKGISLEDIWEVPLLEDNAMIQDDKVVELVEHEYVFFDPSISEQSRNLVKYVDGAVRITQSTKKGYIVAEHGDGVNLAFPTSKTRRGRVIKKKSSTVDCACDICVFQHGTIRRFTITELERLQTLPDGYTKGFPASVAKKAIGNGWTVDVIAHIFKNLRKEKQNG